MVGGFIGKTEREKDSSEENITAVNPNVEMCQPGPKVLDRSTLTQDCCCQQVKLPMMMRMMMITMIMLTVVSSL